MDALTVGSMGELCVYKICSNPVTIQSKIFSYHLQPQNTYIKV